ncbi:MAG: hypothetical protein KH338_10125 [Oscillospiraceae bacterium]|nr:hypothetical protein [Oscillospiraceae bacterium]
MLYSLFKLHIPVLRIQLTILWGAFLVIQFIISVVMVLIRPEESILISGTLLPFAGAFSLFALTQRLVLVTFQDGVRMGRTRRQMLGLTLALIGADALLVSLSALLLPWLERTLCIRLWALLARRPGAAVMVEAPGGGQLWDPSYDTGLLRVEDFGLDAWWLAPLILLAGLLLGFLLAALTQRFGPRSYLLPSILYLYLIFGPRAEWLRDVRLLLPAALLLAAGLACSLWSLLHAPVRQSS